MSVLDFESYKTTGELKYLSGSAAQKTAALQEQIQQEQEELDSIASVMEMSTDELIGELTVRNTTGRSLREIKTDHMVEELTQRLLAIEYILMVTIASCTVEDDD